MFTGIIEEVGVVKAISTTATGHRLVVQSRTVAAEAKPGESIAVNGVCLTVVEFAPPASPSGAGWFAADILQRTWEVTNLSALSPGNSVNLERALRAGDAVGGHFVLGHVDGQGIICSRRTEGTDFVMGISVESKLAEGLVPRGSVAVDGVSLTVARSYTGIFYVHLVPYTLGATTLGRKLDGNRVNVEVDILGKYAGRQSGEGITKEFLSEQGFI